MILDTWTKTTFIASLMIGFLNYRIETKQKEEKKIGEKAKYSVLCGSEESKTRFPL